MSKISNIYGRIVTVLETMFSDKTRIPYPYDLESNNQTKLVNGYGLRIGASSFEELDLCTFNLARDIDIVFTRQVMRLDSDDERLDVLIKAMLEDVYTVQKSFYNYDELEISDDIARVRIIGVSAPEEVIGDNKKFLTVTASFTFDVRERL